MKPYLISDNPNPRVDITERLAESWQIEAREDEEQQETLARMWRVMGAVYVAGFFSCLVLFGLGGLVVGALR